MNEKLTAYALNELPPDERAEFEAQLKNDPALRTQVDEMKAFCAMLSEEVTAGDDALTTEQRGSVMRAFAVEPVEKRNAAPFWRRPAFFVPTALAACVVFMLVVNPQPHSGTVTVEEVAQAPQPSEEIRVLARRKEVRRDTPAPVPAKPATPELLTAMKESPSFDPPQMPAGTVAAAGDKPADALGLDVNGRSRMAGGPTVKGQAGSGPAPVGGTISGADGITKAGDGTLTLGGVNTYAGGTVVSGGTLSMTGDVSVPSNGLVLPAESAGPGAKAANAITANGSMTTAPTSSLEPQKTRGNSTVALGKVMAPPAPTSPVPAQPVTRSVGAAVTLPAATPRTTIAMPPAGATLAAAGIGNTTAAPASAPTAADPLFGTRRLHEERFKEIDKTKNWFGNSDLDARRSDPSGETYTRIYENPFLFVAQQPLSTFSIDVDTASYANVRRFLNKGQRPPADAVRLEELVNYFPYNYEGPSDGKPFGVMVDIAEAPWQPMHRLVRVALKGREVKEERGAANFVFLVDVSGSMDSPDKLPLVQRSLEMLTRQLGDKDRVALVVYAGNSGLVLPSTVGTEKETIAEAIANLKAGGSTNGAGGIRLAYEQASKHFIKGGVNRVILCTDGDFNVGISTPEELEKLIAEKAKSRVFLSVLGFGTGNLKDRTMETLADKGNGNYAYIDSLSEARKVLVEQMNGTLVTIAKDVKIQVEFNPSQVAAYRLLGYENRILAKEDFNNDRKDAGEIGAGHTVTALYEVVPASVKFPDGKPLVDELKYAAKAPVPAAEPAPFIKSDAPASNELMTVKLRYKQPEGDKSDLLEVPVTDKGKKLAESPRDFQFAASVAGFGMLLRGSQHAGELTWDMVRELALRGKGEDTLGYRGEFLQLIDKARGLTEQRQ